MKKLRILFIGNSHTYYNDMPNMVAEKSRKEGINRLATSTGRGGTGVFRLRRSCGG